jgi:hypothetical protein
MRLFHFSDDPSIEVFVPRPVTVPSDRGPGNDWMNGPLVWAISDAFQAMYLFPRDCPRIVVLRKAGADPADVAQWFGERDCQAVAHIEWDWWDRVRTMPLYRYELPPEPFEDLGDAGHFVARGAVEPIRMEPLTDLPAVMQEARVELRLMHRLTPLWRLWRSTTLHVSGVRLRNAQDWAQAAAKINAG